MTVVIKDNTGSFRDKALGWGGCPISTEGLEIAHFFGGTLESSLRNFANGKANASAIGAPSVNANSVSLQGGLNMIQTTMADTNELTLLIAFKPLEVSDVIIAGNLITPGGGGPTRKVAIAWSAPDLKVNGFRGTDIGGPGAPLPTVLVPAIPVCMSLRNNTGANPTVKLNNLTKGEVGTAVNPGTPSLGSAIRVGGAYSTGYSGKSEVYAVLGFSRNLTDAELATLYAWLKGYCARRNIVI